jgi:hypothetical protein
MGLCGTLKAVIHEFNYYEYNQFIMVRTSCDTLAVLWGLEWREGEV